MSARNPLSERTSTDGTGTGVTISNVSGLRPSPAPGDTHEWLDTCLSAAVRVTEVDVDGVPITYREWGRGTAPGLLLIHGGAAHSRWWDAIAPHLSGDRRVVALDLSGHGDSGSSTDVRSRDWADEVLAVIEASRLGARLRDGRPQPRGHGRAGGGAAGADPPRTLLVLHRSAVDQWSVHGWHRAQGSGPQGAASLPHGRRGDRTFPGRARRSTMVPRHYRPISPAPPSVSPARAGRGSSIRRSFGGRSTTTG